MNKDLRTPTKDSNNVDIHISGVSIEKSAKLKPPVSSINVSSYTIHYVLNGCGYIVVNGIKHKLERDTVFVTFPKINVINYQDPETPWTIGWMVLDGLKVRQYLERFFINEKKPFLKVPFNKKLRTLFSSTPKRCEKYANISDIIATSALYQILEIMGTQQPNNDTLKISPITEEYVAFAIEYVNNNYSESTLNLCNVANKIGISSRYLSFIFKKITRVTFSNHLLNKRISAAISLFDKGETYITQVSDKVGFSSPYYFSNQFKKINSISPKQYIKNKKI